MSPFSRLTGNHLCPSLVTERHADAWCANCWESFVSRAENVERIKKNGAMFTMFYISSQRAGVQVVYDKIRSYL